MAAEKGHMKIAVHLVDKGAEINTIDGAGVSFIESQLILIRVSFFLRTHYSCGMTL